MQGKGGTRRRKVGRRRRRRRMTTRMMPTMMRGGPSEAWTAWLPVPTSGPQTREKAEKKAGAKVPTG